MKAHSSETQNDSCDSCFCLVVIGIYINFEWRVAETQANFAKVWASALLQMGKLSSGLVN